MITVERQIELLRNFKVPGQIGSDEWDAVSFAIKERLQVLRRMKHEKDNACENCGGFGFGCYC
jgi:hypothetical protein